MAKIPQPPLRPVPWLTASITGAALLCYFVPEHGLPGLAYDRDRLLSHCEFWRLWTSHVVHFSPSHLFWNLAVLIPTGVWLEHIAPSRTRLLYVLTPFVTGLALLAFDPTLQTFGGLSGLATATITLLALTQQSRVAPRDRVWWRLVLALIAAKTLLETTVSMAVFASFSDVATRPVPLAHLVGISCAAIFGLLGSKMARFR